MTEFRYLIGFVSGRGHGLYYGRCDIIRPTPITCDRDVNDVERELRNHLADPDLAVLSFSCYTDPTPGR